MTIIEARRNEESQMSENGRPVLVVEDDPEINELVGAYVQIAGFGYERALCGQEAVDKARATHPALIVLDIMLPDFDGFEVARRLKNEVGTRSIPIVILTALDRDEYRQRGKTAGAVGYLTKPFDPERLLEAIKQNASVNGVAK
jgi:two-component system OmpR family response regulator